MLCILKKLVYQNTLKPINWRKKKMLEKFKHKLKIFIFLNPED